MKTLRLVTLALLAVLVLQGCCWHHGHRRGGGYYHYGGHYGGEIHLRNVIPHVDLTIR
jgi:hypothetical protein